MTVTYPGTVTPHGWYHIVKGDQPDLVLKGYDASTEFWLSGGRSIADRYAAPECVQIPADGLKGLIPPWKHIQQKGATQDGVTHIDALYDPIEVELSVVCRGRDPQYTRAVVRDLIASLDAKQQAELGFTTKEGGYWWAPVRWFQGAPPDPLLGVQTRRQKLSLRLQADDGFWRTYDDTGMFRFAYADMTDNFAVNYSAGQNLGPNWPQRYTGTGGYCTTTTGFLNLSEARWYPSGTAAREVVNGPYKDFATATDNQVVEMSIGALPQLVWYPGAYNDLWGRMGVSGGAWDGNGIRARFGVNGLLAATMRLSRFNNFNETIMYEGWLGTPPGLGIPPVTGEKFTLICGQSGAPRTFIVLRNGLPILTHVENGTGSALGAAYRGVGFGMRAGTGLISQAQPAFIRDVSAGDNATITQAGWIARTNIGDQPMYDDLTVFGPGTFHFADAPGTTSPYVTFGPLLPNQVAFIRTDPRKRTVIDLTSTPPTPQQLTLFQQALQQLLSFATGNNVPPLLQAFESAFGIQPPQGNMYSLLDGRFSDAAAIPAKSPGAAASTYYRWVSIENGDATSKVIATGTPKRRWPL